MQRNHSCILSGGVSTLTNDSISLHIAYIVQPFSLNIERILAGNTNENSKKLFIKPLMTNIMVMFKDAEDGESQDITKMEQDAFNLFLDTFGETISGFKEFSDYNKQISLFSETCTVSDEAIVLFFLKKNWDKWSNDIGEMSQVNQEVIELTDKHQVERANNHIIYTKKHSNKKFGGWTPEGIERYNEITYLVFCARQTQVRKRLERAYKNMKVLRNEDLRPAIEQRAKVDRMLKALPVPYTT